MGERLKESNTSAIWKYPLPSQIPKTCYTVM